MKKVFNFAFVCAAIFALALFAACSNSSGGGVSATGPDTGGASGGSSGGGSGSGGGITAYIGSKKPNDVWEVGDFVYSDGSADPADATLDATKKSRCCCCDFLCWAKF